jgi:signal transduction histidine kinase
LREAADISGMSASAHSPVVRADIETAILGVAISAETARGGAAELLAQFAPLLDDTGAAIAVRDRDGISLQVLAESGEPARWPERLPAEFALGASGVDQRSGVWLAPLRAHGRVLGALLIADAARGAELGRNPMFVAALHTAALVLKDMIERMDAQLQRQAEWVRSVDAIAEGLTHQIANPLTGASAVLQLLAEEIPDASQRSAIQRAQTEIGRALAVVEDMHAIQRDTGAQDGILDLGSFVERMVRFRLYHIREAGITLALDVEPGFLGVRTDARGLEHALLAALRFAELRSGKSVNRSILVRVAQRSSIGYEVKITDSGPGDVPEIEPLYFDMTLRPPEHLPRENREPVPDLGLVRSILRGCGGYLEVRGSKTDGTTLTLVLPRASASPQHSTAVLS